VSNCGDVQATAAAAASLSEKASQAMLFVSASANVAEAGTVSAAPTSFTLSVEWQSIWIEALMRFELFGQPRQEDLLEHPKRTFPEQELARISDELCMGTRAALVIPNV
jgi:hypothetical protein